MAFYTAQLAALEEAAAGARREAHRRFLSWSLRASLALAVLLVGLGIFLPVGKKMLFTAALAATGAAVAAYLLGELLTWLPLVGVAVAALALGVVAWQLWRRLRVAVQTVEMAGNRDGTGKLIEAERIKTLQGILQPEMKRLAHKFRGAMG